MGHQGTLDVVFGADALSGWKSQESDGAVWEEPSSHCGREDLSGGWLPESALIVKNHHGKQRGFVFSEGDIADFA